MSAQENKRLALLYLERLHSPDGVDSAFAMMAPDAIIWITTDQPGGSTITREEMRQGAHACYRAYKQCPVVKTRIIAAEDDIVCVEAESRGARTHKGASYENDYFVWMRFRDGLIVEFREYFNPILAAGLMAELGDMS